MEGDSGGMRTLGLEGCTPTRGAQIERVEEETGNGESKGKGGVCVWDVRSAGR